MARGKKTTKVLTLEEKLEQALVPEEEQPYSVPENWCWTTVDKISDVVTGGTPSKMIPEYYGGDFPFFKPSDLDAGRHVFYASEYLSEQGKAVARTIPAKSTAVCCIGSIGKCGYLEIEGTTNQQINSAIPYFNPIYQYYYMNTGNFINQLLSKASATTISIVNKAKMESCYFPLAPLGEQQRIVDRIENIFAKLDGAKEKAQAVVNGFELRKSAILYKAFTGELTEQWRKANGVGMDNWKQYTVGDVCKDVKVGIVIKPSQYYTDEKKGVPAFRSANVRERRIDDFDWVYLNKKGMTDNKRSIVHTGDVLVVRSGSPGTACVVPESFDGYNAIDILIAVPNQELVLPDFLCLFTNSPLGKKSVSERKRGMALAHFNVKGYSKVEIDIPLITEQEEIICILEKLLEKEQKVKEFAESVIDQIDAMKKAVLARAFRGELGTNDPEEENAVELLKAVLSSRR